MSKWMKSCFGIINVPRDCVVLVQMQEDDVTTIWIIMSKKMQYPILKLLEMLNDVCIMGLFPLCNVMSVCCCTLYCVHVVEVIRNVVTIYRSLSICFVEIFVWRIVRNGSVVLLRIDFWNVLVHDMVERYITNQLIVCVGARRDKLCMESNILWINWILRAGFCNVVDIYWRHICNWINCS